ncbi:hypothetical protein D3C76_1486990 [compost metagenome]
MTVATKVTVVLEFAAMDPKLIPVAGLTPGVGTPLMMTLFVLKTAPAGIGSVKVTEAAMLPVLLI